MPTRRNLLQGTLAAAAGLAGPAAVPAAAPALARPPVFLVPGYFPERAWRGGRPLRADPQAARALPPGYEGPVTLLSRVQRDAPARRALMPLRGHDIELSPDRRRAAFAAMDHDALLLFDPESLDLLVTGRPHADDFAFGGHVAYAADGAVMFAAERRNDALPFTGRAADYAGRISVRDAESLQVLAVLDGHGIAPHEIALLEDGRHLAIANYGSTRWPAGAAPPAAGLRHGLEPSLTVIDVRDGRLVHKLPLSRTQHELRHLGAARLDRIFGMQVRMDSFDAAQRLLRGREQVYEPDRTDPYGRGYLPVPVLRFDLNGPVPSATGAMTADPLLMQRGQSIAYDPVHDEAIGVFTSAHAVVVFDGASGAVKAVVRTDRVGLRLPRGIALMPDGETYAVSGHWADIFVFRRGRHDLLREACCYVPLFGHSHLAVA